MTPGIKPLDIIIEMGRLGLVDRHEAYRDWVIRNSGKLTLDWLSQYECSFEINEIIELQRVLTGAVDILLSSAPHLMPCILSFQMRCMADTLNQLDSLPFVRKPTLILLEMQTELLRQNKIWFAQEIDHRMDSLHESGYSENIKSFYYNLKEINKETDPILTFPDEVMKKLMIYKLAFNPDS